MKPGEEHATVRLDSDAARQQVQKISLRVLSGPDKGLAHESTGDRVVVGTHPSSQLALSDETVSRFHCEITFVGGRPFLRDLGSTNGTSVDGVPVSSAPLREEATIGVGQSAVRFRLGEERISLVLSTNDRFGLLVGRSAVMRAAFARLEKAAANGTTVLLEGETGTGKDLAAESLHREGPRRQKPFVALDCGALPLNLMESELFGHERGAFTGAEKPRAGAFEVANGGTLFLDEIGELSLDLQPKLLRVLEKREVRRLGSSQSIPIDVQLVAATNRNLRTEVNERRFRPDLYYRLAVMEVRLPPLRERMDDLPLLVEHLIQEMGATDRAQAFQSPETLSRLSRHDWPGNVRELRNYLERSVALETFEPLQATDSDGSPAIDIHQPIAIARERWVLHFERRYLEELLRVHGNNVSAAARAAGVARIHLYRLMTRCGLRGAAPKTPVEG
jgi:two-component system, NtrC family, response regulator GlrR